MNKSYSALIANETANQQFKSKLTKFNMAAKEKEVSSKQLNSKRLLTHHEYYQNGNEVNKSTKNSVKEYYGIRMNLRKPST